MEVNNQNKYSRTEYIYINKSPRMKDKDFDFLRND